MAKEEMQWRSYLATAPNKATVFDIIDQAITAAATDFPDEFIRRKSRILDSLQSTDAPVVKSESRIIRIKIKSPKTVMKMDQEKEEEESCSVVEPTKNLNEGLHEEAKRHVIRIKIKKPTTNQEEESKEACNHGQPIKKAKKQLEVTKKEPIILGTGAARAQQLPAAMDEMKQQPKIEERAKAWCLDDEEAAMEAKLEATKKRMLERYEEIERAKKQTRIQLINYLPNQQGQQHSNIQKKRTAAAVGNKSMPAGRIVRC